MYWKTIENIKITDLRKCLLKLKKKYIVSPWIEDIVNKNNFFISKNCFFVLRHKSACVILPLKFTAVLSIVSIAAPDAAKLPK